MKHREIINTIINVFRDAPAIRALFLSGSYANGLSDVYSDLDFILVANDDATNEVAALWRKPASQTGDIVLWQGAQTCAPPEHFYQPSVPSANHLAHSEPNSLSALFR